MKIVALSLTLLFVSLMGLAQENQGIQIKVTIDNVTSDEGQVLAGLHTADTFMKGAGFQNTVRAIENGKVTFTFDNVIPGTYAIMALHDANENNRMDYQENGMPKESYGMSGNDMSYGPPTFEMAKFEVKEEDLELSIRF
ncbi:DUF2141 domain-containing protein [Muricauda sp. JGD-17]|uniref:DUF2141 domain-containing protein n=1 Tax=Flagellimonas ochracea TaxID=2696472 RepID=A0A964T955_9FLAO|nr:DUF2141 domain-containing protein [Allomuricauda ochracea]NAY90545.1 DUF2141 domain-containing protein [Allomuricauda ochracea]